MNKMEVDLTLKDIVDFLYPIGSLYYTQDSNFNPNEHFGGTWVQIKDKFILACGETYKINQTGGEASHVLTEKEMPKHFHIFPDGNIDQSAPLWSTAPNTGNKHLMNSRQWTSKTSETGGGLAHNNMPPYETAYIWKRTGE